MNKKQQKPLKTFAGLVKAIDWYDVSLQSILKDLGMQSVNRTQSMILVHIARGVTRPSDIAREMGTTRQNIHAMAKDLIAKNILTQLPDSNDGRSKTYSFARDGLKLRNMVLKILAYLDKKLCAQLGKTNLNALNKALSAEWGEYELVAPKKLKTTEHKI